MSYILRLPKFDAVAARLPLGLTAIKLMLVEWTSLN